MEYNLLPYLSACSEILADALPLLLYTHIPAAVAATLFGGYVLYQVRTLQGAVLCLLAGTYVLWVLSNITVWIFYDHPALQITVWSFFGFLTVLIFFFSHWFIHIYLNNETPRWLLLTWAMLISPILILTPTAFNVSGVDIQSCASIENDLFSNSYYSLGVIAVILSLVSAYIWQNKILLDSPSQRNSKWIVLISGLLFIVAFLFTGAIDSYLVSAGLIPDFGFEMYGVATMAIFIGMLVYATVQYGAFNLKLLAAQALVITLVLLIAAQYLFITSTISQILLALTLGLAVAFGTLLVKSVQAEVKARERIEQQERELEVVNERQKGLLHFISHEIKGYLTKGQNAFAGIVEGDYGEVPPAVKELSTGALEQMRRGVSTVMDILDASNLKKGTITFDKKPFDLKAAVESVCNDLKKPAQERNLSLVCAFDEGSYKYTGDEAKLRRHVFRNLIDNSIRYTPSGSITVSLGETNGTVHFSVKDTGVGISADDMPRLFTEGGHGKDSIKVNVDSTGYGLFVAKQVVEAHGGKISVHSDGPGKGSEFKVDFPVV